MKILKNLDIISKISANMNTFKATLFLLLLFSFTSSFAQDLNNNQLGLVFTPCLNKVYQFQENFHEDSEFEGKYGFTIGIKYIRIVGNNLWIETGINYSEIRIYLKTKVTLINEYYPRKERRDMLTIPVNLHIKNNNGYFISLGPQLDLEINAWTRSMVNNQSGVGFNIGLGKYFHITENIYFSSAITVKAHALIPFYEVSNHQRLFEYGLKFDINYGFLQ